MRGIVALLIVSVLLPSAGAQLIIPIEGTEELPELPDAEGDVTTAPGYLGPTDFIDLTAAWFEYVNATDKVVLTMRVASGEDLGNAPPGYKVGCFVTGVVTKGDEGLGNLTFTWWQPEDHSSIQHTVYWNPKPAPGVAPLSVVPHEFSSELETPAYFAFAAPRTDLIKLGDEIQNPTGRCSAYIDEPDNPLASTPDGVRLAVDSAQSEAIYSFYELRQSRTAQGEVLDPIEEFERENATASPSSSEESLGSQGGTPALGALMAALIVVAAAAFLKHRRQA